MPRQQGRFAGQSFAQYVPQYAGAPLEEITDTLSALSDRYKTAVENYQALDVLAENTPVLSKDEQYKQAALAEIDAGIQGTVTSGRWQDAPMIVNQLATNFATNPGLKAAMQSKGVRDEYIKQEQDRFLKGEITEKDMQDNIARADAYYKGVRLDDRSNTYYGTYNPINTVKDQDIAKKLWDLAKEIPADGSPIAMRDSSGKIMKDANGQTMYMQKDPTTGYFVTKEGEGVSATKIKNTLMYQLDADDSIQRLLDQREQNALFNKFYDPATGGMRPIEVADFRDVLSEEDLKKYATKLGSYTPEKRAEVYTELMRENDLQRYVKPAETGLTYYKSKNDYVKDWMMEQDRANTAETSRQFQAFVTSTDGKLQPTQAFDVKNTNDAISSADAQIAALETAEKTRNLSPQEIQQLSELKTTKNVLQYRRGAIAKDYYRSPEFISYAEEKLNAGYDGNEMSKQIEMLKKSKVYDQYIKTPENLAKWLAGDLKLPDEAMEARIVELPKYGNIMGGVDNAYFQPAKLKEMILNDPKLQENLNNYVKGKDIAVEANVITAKPISGANATAVERGSQLLSDAFINSGGSIYIPDDGTGKPTTLDEFMTKFNISKDTHEITFSPLDEEMGGDGYYMKALPKKGGASKEMYVFPQGDILGTQKQFAGHLVKMALANEGKLNDYNQDPDMNLTRESFGNDANSSANWDFYQAGIKKAANLEFGSEFQELMAQEDSGTLPDEKDVYIKSNGNTYRMYFRTFKSNTEVIDSQGQPHKTTKVTYNLIPYDSNGNLLTDGTTGNFQAFTGNSIRDLMIDMYKKR